MFQDANLSAMAEVLSRSGNSVLYQGKHQDGHKKWKTKYHHYAEDGSEGDRRCDIVAVCTDDRCTAAMAELPQIELPQAMRTDILCGKPTPRQIP
jgi:hypothetical protein